jgi:hypothetical protein
MCAETSKTQEANTKKQIGQRRGPGVFLIFCVIFFGGLRKKSVVFLIPHAEKHPKQKKIQLRNKRQNNFLFFSDFRH